MKEYTALTANLLMVLNEDGSTTPVAECILLLSEPQYSIDQTGQIVKARKVECLRFGASEHALGHLIKSLARVQQEIANLSEPQSPKAAAA